MRQAEPRPAARAAGSIVFRRQLRRFGALSQLERITNQGRITIPVPFREILKLQPGTEAVLVGTEIGVEVWNAEVWQNEFAVLAEHELKKAAAEMDADLEMDHGARPRET
jgi:DNA-binding transcriptional regulator/RsmH inhibitor MraZ